VLSAVPEYATAVGVPARVVKVAGRRVDDLDHTHIPDPIMQELCRINRRIDELAQG